MIRYWLPSVGLLALAAAVGYEWDSRLRAALRSVGSKDA